MLVYIITIFLGLAFLVFIGILVYRISKKIGSDMPVKPSIVVTFDPSKTGGHCLLVVKSIDSKFGDRLIIEAKPLDLPYDPKGKSVECPNQRFAVRKEKAIMLSEGALSAFRDFIIIAPENSMMLDERFRNSPVGFGFCMMCELTEFKDKALDSVMSRQFGERSTMALLESEENKLVTMVREAARKIKEDVQSKAPNVEIKT